MQSLTTEAIIIAQWQARECDRWVRFVSSHLGLTEGRAISALATKSKLGPHLLTYHSVRLTVISGRSSRRIIGARQSENLPDNSLPVVALWCAVLERLSPRQPKDEKLFDILKTLYSRINCETDRKSLSNEALLGLATLFAYFGFIPWSSPILKKPNLALIEEALFAIIERPMPAWEYFKKSEGFFRL